MKNIYAEIADRILDGGEITCDEAMRIARTDDSETFDFMFQANRLREHYFGNSVHLCSIINAKSGLCPEDCSFCAQSVMHDTGIDVYPLVDEDKIVTGAQNAEKAGSRCFGIVTSGSSAGKGSELDSICGALGRIAGETSISPACSLGTIDMETALALKQAGMTRYHHNLETARSFFHNVCTTHDYEKDIDTIRTVKSAGLEVCCGGIFGLGESPDQRVEFAFTLKELGVDSIPVNFLNPVPGTRLADADYLTPMECLRIIALFRFILPDKRISVCGGREKNLRDLQSLIFFAGANGMMIGNYLTTVGRTQEHDRQMLEDLGMRITNL
jgi:biotin synthase